MAPPFVSLCTYMLFFAVGFSLYSMAVGEKTILSQGVSQEFLSSFFSNHM
jgi:hypothetical protein